MARGKEAVQAANRRAADAETTLAVAKERLAAERVEIHAENERLKLEVQRLNREADSIAAERADAQVRQRLEELENERHRRGLTEEVVVYLARAKDFLIRNACKYVSMTTGEPPDIALPMVLAWMTERTIHEVSENEDFLLSLGLPLDGWVASESKQIKRRQDYGRRGPKGVAAISLTDAEQELDPRIHPDYQTRWYVHVDPPTPPYRRRDAQVRKAFKAGSL